MQQNVAINPGMKQANINLDNVAQPNQYLQRNDISNLNIKIPSKDGGNKNNIPSNSNPVIENRGKVDVKRETNKLQKNIKGKIKLPGRDLKAVNANLFGNNYDEEREKSKVVRRDAVDTLPEQFLDVQDTRMSQSLKNENLSKLAIAGASMGIVRTRHLLSEDSKER